MVKGRRKSRSKTCGDFSLEDDRIRKLDIPGEGIYEGHTKDGLREGKGKLQDLRGGCFVGEWVGGVQSGYGAKSYKSGDRHEGSYFDGKRHGNGIYMWRNGDVYSGGWTRGFIDGKGSFTWASGDKYVGFWLKGEMHGEGVKVQADGSVLKGHFFRGKSHGWAKKVYECGDKYSGNYFLNSREGYGEYLWADGTVYRGQWLRDKMTGFGEKCIKPPQTAMESLQLMSIGAPLSIIAYRGEFKNGQREGKGVAVMCDNSRYTGDWIEDLMDGWGCLEGPSGASYDGGFVSGMRQGVGISVYPPTCIPHTLNLKESKSVDDENCDVDDLIDLILEKRYNFQTFNRITQRQEQEQLDDDEVDEFDYTINRLISVEHILRDCRDFRVDKKGFKNNDDDSNDSNNNQLNLDDCCSYRGNWYNDLPHGGGVIELRNGQVFTGNFVRGIRTLNS